MVLHLMKMEQEEVTAFSGALTQMRNELKFCIACHNVSDAELCDVCKNPGRNRSQICVVETIRDVIAIESTRQFAGLYHVLGGILSPLDGIGPEHLKMESLIKRVSENEVQELIMALSPTIEGDTTVYYIAKQVQQQQVNITTIARGISFGGELEYADEMTLARSISKRLPIENYVSMGKT